MGRTREDRHRKRNKREKKNLVFDSQFGERGKIGNATRVKLPIKKDDENGAGLARAKKRLQEAAL